MAPCGSASLPSLTVTDTAPKLRPSWQPRKKRWHCIRDMANSTATACMWPPKSEMQSSAGREKRGRPMSAGQYRAENSTAFACPALTIAPSCPFARADKTVRHIVLYGRVQCERGRSTVRYDRECSKKQAGKSAGKIKRSAGRLRHSDDPLEQTYKNTDIE